MGAPPTLLALDQALTERLYPRDRATLASQSSIGVSPFSLFRRRKGEVGGGNRGERRSCALRRR
jgi:hypothetical protein